MLDLGHPGKRAVRRDQGARLTTDGGSCEHGVKALELRKWEHLNPDRLRYQMIFAAADTVTADQTREARHFVEEAET